MPTQGINGPFPFQTRKYFDNAGDTNAAKGSTLTFEELDKTLLFLSASVASGSDATLEQQVIPTLEVGGYNESSTLPVGMTFTQFVVNLLTPYQPASISSLTIKDGSTAVTMLRELGNAFTADFVTFSASNDSNNNYPHSASITWTGNDGIDVTDLSLTDNILGSSNTLPLPSTYTFGRDAKGTISFTVTSKTPDDISNLITSTASTYRIKSILSGNPNTTISNAQTFYNALLAETGENTALNSSAAWNVGGNAAAGGNPSRGNYPYYVFDNSFTTPTQFQYNAGTAAVSSAWTDMGTITVNNEYGVSVTLKVLRGNDPEGYPPGATLNFL